MAKKAKKVAKKTSRAPAVFTRGMKLYRFEYSCYARKAQMVSNLLVVLCSEQQTQPVVNTGTLYA